MSDVTLLPDLASRLLGGGVVGCNDEFFAPADSLVAAHEPSFTPQTFGAKGQVYDGWETRRRRTPGQDWAIVRLGAPGIVHGVVIDTAWFTGNYPPFASVDGSEIAGYPGLPELVDAAWRPLVPRSALEGNQRNLFVVDQRVRCTHVRLTIYPDGGVARLRVHGEAVPDPALLTTGLVDLAAMEHGGRVVDCSNRFYGSPNNLLLPGRARTMGEGWETARRRDDGNDWVEIRLGLSGVVRMVDVDTTHFKGNAPGAAAISGVDEDGATFPILPRTSLLPDTPHRFPVEAGPVASAVRLDVFPDGGLARLRLWGQPA
jgi:allantoicase